MRVSTGPRGKPDRVMLITPGHSSVSSRIAILIMVTSFEENAASAASIFLRAGAEDSTLTTGRYSLDGSIVNMKSESSEYIGQMSGDTLELEFYSHKTKKGGEHVFTYHPVETIRQDVFNQTGPQQEAPQP
jgi:hypothetical protein